MRLLLLSNSTNPGESYLSWPEKIIKKFIGSISENILFIPYAGVSINWDAYHEKVATRFNEWGFDVESIHHKENPKKAIKEADVILTGGGNTFNLLATLQDYKLLEPLREQIKNDIPFIGWSAGSNICCPTIMTTNDMPVVEPKGFKALGVIPFQINPHYTDWVDPDHGGESRDDRIEEFLIKNRDTYVVGLPERTALLVEKESYRLLGKSAKLFKHGQNITEFDDSYNFDFL